MPKDPDNSTYRQSNDSPYHRYTYPTSEQDYTFENWKAAVGASDAFSTKTRWEK